MGFNSLDEEDYGEGTSSGQFVGNIDFDGEEEELDQPTIIDIDFNGERVETNQSTEQLADNNEKDYEGSQAGGWDSSLSDDSNEFADYYEKEIDLNCTNLWN